MTRDYERSSDSSPESAENCQLRGRIEDLARRIDRLNHRHRDLEMRIDRAEASVRAYVEIAKWVAAGALVLSGALSKLPDRIRAILFGG
jgi:predicted RNase H-like nuclease (RuvC/YqgF family)